MKEKNLSIKSGSDVWPALFPKSTIKKYQITFRASSEMLSIRSRLLWKDVKKTLNMAFNWFESVDLKVSRVVLNSKDVEKFSERTGFKSRFWGATIYVTDLVPQGYFLCESKTLR